MEQHLVHYCYTGWPDYNIVQPNKLIDLIETINKHREYSFNLYENTTRIPSSPTVVHCRYKFLKIDTKTNRLIVCFY